MPLRLRTALCAPSHPATHGRRDFPEGAVRFPKPGDDAIRLLREAHELRVPLDGQVPAAQDLTEQALVVVLPEDEEVGIGAEIAADVAQRHARHAPASRPHVGAGGALAQLHRALGDAEVGVDLEGAGLDAEGAGLERGAGVAVDDRRAHAPPGELIGEHQTGGASADDQDISVRTGLVGRLRQSIGRDSSRHHLGGASMPPHRSRSLMT